MSNLWGVLWRSENRKDGVTRHLIRDGLPKLFLTKAQAQAWISEKYGYFSERTDLRYEPHGWRMPVPVKVSISWRDE